ncbi:unnamed protein product [Laminaria digitata]
MVSTVQGCTFHLLRLLPHLRTCFKAITRPKTDFLGKKTCALRRECSIIFGALHMRSSFSHPKHYLEENCFCASKNPTNILCALALKQRHSKIMIISYSLGGAQPVRKY